MALIPDKVCPAPHLLALDDDNTVLTTKDIRIALPFLRSERWPNLTQILPTIGITIAEFGILYVRQINHQKQSKGGQHQSTSGGQNTSQGRHTSDNKQSNTPLSTCTPLNTEAESASSRNPRKRSHAVMMMRSQFGRRFQASNNSTSADEVLASIDNNMLRRCLHDIRTLDPINQHRRISNGQEAGDFSVAYVRKVRGALHR